MTKLTSFNTLRALIAVILMITALLWGHYIINLRSGLAVSNIQFYDKLTFVAISATLGAYSFIIIFKSKQHHSYLIALFLAMLSQNMVLNLLILILPKYYMGFFVHAALTGTSFVYAMRFFPRKLAAEDFSTVYRPTIIQRFLVWSTKPIFLALFPLMLFGTYLLKMAFVGNLLAFAVSILFLRTNYRLSGAEGRDKVLWFFWGVLTYMILTFIQVICAALYAESAETIATIFHMLKMITLLTTLTMSLFFFNSFDTGVVIKRTIVDSFIFLSIVILYNTIEHYALHWISHKLHLSDVLISSVLSAILVTLVSPLHHKLMHYLERTVKKSEH